ncbi:hypothetical protein QQP08_003966 [Theobroma cacao]|nr:hypothetical protein QQP08_003966 [Theobroma cacao]
MAINSHANDAKLHIIVDGVMAHHDEIFRLNSNVRWAENESEIMSATVPLWAAIEIMFLIHSLSFNNWWELATYSNPPSKLKMHYLKGWRQCSSSSGSFGNAINYIGKMAMVMGMLEMLEGFIH